MNLKEDYELGRLCEEGYLTERFDMKLNDLVRTVTPKGIKKIKETLSDPAYLNEFKQMIINMLKTIEPKHRASFIKLLRDRLNG